MKKLDILETTITSLGYGGQGIAKPKGAVLFVPRGLPGDRLKVRVINMKKRYVTAEILKIIKPSPSRIDPRCSGFDNGCGGCHWLHMRYEDQLYHKEKILRETLKHIGKLSIKVNPVIAAKHQKGCRNKFSLRVDDSRAIGLCREKSRIVLNLNECKMELETNEACYRAIKEVFASGGASIDATQIHIRSGSDGRIGICLFAPEQSARHKQVWHKLKMQLPLLTGMGVKTRNRYSHIAGETLIFEKIEGLIYGIPLQSFFQTHYGQAAELLKIVHKSANLSLQDTVLDLYCGVGFFTLGLAGFCSSVHGIEFDNRAVMAGRENAERNNIENVSFTAGDVKEIFASGKIKKPDIIVLDPPRSGCERAVLEGIVALEPERIVYVSCAPDSLARDLSVLTEAGYRITDCQPIDMFPQTFHIESVIKLER